MVRRFFSSTLRFPAVWVAVGLLASGCGGGGGGGGGGSAATTAGEPSPTATPFAHSVALGSWSPQSIAYVAGSGTTADTVSSAASSALLPQGAAPLLARHAESSLPGALEVCVSGNGQGTNIVSPINLGVVAQSAAVLLDASWNAVPDAAAAWAALAQRKAVLVGWENCGAKPEGAPSPSSRLTLQADGSYAEDVYDGNPGTTYNVVSQVFTAAQVAAMLGPQGWSTVADPTRPMQLFWRIYANGQGQQLLVEMGLPRATAPASLKGFIALYVPAS